MNDRTEPPTPHAAAPAKAGPSRDSSSRPLPLRDLATDRRKIQRLLALAPTSTFLVTLAFAFALSLGGECRAAVVSVADFGARPDDGVNDADALRAAVSAARRQPGTTLLLPPGVYELRDEAAVRMQEDGMTGKFGNNPERTLFRPYHPRVIGLDFGGARDLTVQATGAVLRCDGWMEPVSLVDCRRVTVRGLTIDYVRKPFSEGPIVAIRGDSFDVDFGTRFPLHPETPLCRMMVWDRQRERLTGGAAYHLKARTAAPGILTIPGGTLGGKIGDIAMIVHGFHARPAIFIHRSEDILLDGVTLHAQEGMGIVGDRVHNLTVKRLRVVPAPGLHQSTNTDASHYTSCTGLLRYEDCEFLGQGDDAINVHNYYQTVTRSLGGNRYEAKSPLWYSHGGVLDHYDVGDTIERVSRETLAVEGTCKVLAVTPYPNEWRQEITLDAPLPENAGTYYLANATRFPRVEMVRCTMKSHLARSVLLKNRRSLLEDCVFDQCTGTAVHVGAEGDWHESGPCEEVVIRRCRFIRNGRGAGTEDGACAVAVNIKAPRRGVPGIHGRIVIEDNRIEGEDAARGIFITGATEAVVRRNTITGCRQPVVVEATTRVDVSDNTP